MIKMVICAAFLFMCRSDTMGAPLNSPTLDHLRPPVVHVGSNCTTTCQYYPLTHQNICTTHCY